MNPREFEVMAAIESEHWWYCGLRDILARSVRRLLRPRARPIAVLDAGCGTGENLRLLNTLLAPDYLGGFDLSPLALRHAARKIPAADLYLGDICRPELHVPEFDVVTSCDVVDVPGAQAALPGLQRLVSALRPGGLMILNVPAFPWMRSRHDHAVHSRERFTAGSVRQLLLDAALHIELVTYRVCTVFPLIVLSRLPSILRPPLDRAAIRSDLVMPHHVANKLLRKLLIFENAAVFSGLHLPWGSSVFAVARKM